MTAIGFIILGTVTAAGVVLGYFAVTKLLSKIRRVKRAVLRIESALGGIEPKYSTAFNRTRSSLSNRLNLVDRRFERRFTKIAARIERVEARLVASLEARLEIFGRRLADHESNVERLAMHVQGVESRLSEIGAILAASTRLAADSVGSEGLTSRIESVESRVGRGGRGIEPRLEDLTKAEGLRVTSNETTVDAIVGRLEMRLERGSDAAEGGRSSRPDLLERRGATDERLNSLETLLYGLKADLEQVNQAMRESGGAVIPFVGDSGVLERLRIVGPATRTLLPRPKKTKAEASVAQRMYTLEKDGRGVSFVLAALPYHQYYNHFKKIDIVGDWNQDFRALSDEIINTKTTYLLHDRLFVLWQAVQNVARSTAPIVEVGVWRGGSSRFLAEAQRYFNKTGHIYSCDTFVGHPQVTADLDAGHEAGDFAILDVEEVKAGLAQYSEIKIVQGDIMQTASRLDAEQFSLIHLDADVYEPTKFVLEDLVPRLEPDGVVIVDDYGFTTCPGVKQAVDEFVAQNSHYRMFYLFTGQALLVRPSTDAARVASGFGETGARRAGRGRTKSSAGGTASREVVENQ